MKRNNTSIRFRSISGPRVHTAVSKIACLLFFRFFLKNSFSCCLHILTYPVSELNALWEIVINNSGRYSASARNQTKDTRTNTPEIVKIVTPENKSRNSLFPNSSRTPTKLQHYPPLLIRTNSRS